MFGVLWSNLNDWYGVADETTWLDRAIGFVQEYFVEGRFFTLLCFLFGIGFGIQLTRAAQRGVGIQRTYARRSAALLAIGLVHALLIWHGDILTSYALVSFALLLFRDVAPKRQLAWAFALYLFAGDFITRVRWVAGQRFMVPRVPRVTANWIYGHGSLAQIHHQRLLDVADWFGRWGLTTYFYILSIFLAGVWALRSGFFQRVVSDRRATRRFLYWCLGAALVFFAAGAAADAFLPTPSGPPDTTRAVMLAWRRFVFTALDATIPMGLAYGALLLLAFQTKRGAASPRSARRRRPHGAHDVPHAVRRFHVSFLQLRSALVRPHGIHGHVRDHHRVVFDSDRREHVVAQTLSIRAGRVAVEDADLRSGARDARSERRRSAH